MHRCKPCWKNDCDTLIHRHTYGNNKPERHTKEYCVGFATVKDRAGASMTNKIFFPVTDDITGQTQVYSRL